MGVVYLQRKGRHLKVEMLSKALSHGKRRAMEIFSDLVILGTTAILLYSALLVAKPSLQMVTQVLQWPKVLYYGALAAVLVLMIADTLNRLMTKLRQFSKAQQSPDKDSTKP